MGSEFSADGGGDCGAETARVVRNTVAVCVVFVAAGVVASAVLRPADGYLAAGLGACLAVGVAVVLVFELLLRVRYPLHHQDEDLDTLRDHVARGANLEAPASSRCCWRCCWRWCCCRRGRIQGMPPPARGMAPHVSPLHLAVLRGNHHTVQCLIALPPGRRPDVQCPYLPTGWTALHSAVAFNRVRCAQLLLEGGAAVDAVATCGSTPWGLLGYAGRPRGAVVAMTRVLARAGAAAPLAGTVATTAATPATQTATQCTSYALCGLCQRRFHDRHRQRRFHVQQRGRCS